MTEIKWNRLSNEELCMYVLHDKEKKDAALEQLMKRNTGYIRKCVNELAARYPKNGVNKDDLVIEGYIAIMDAAGQYDPDMGTKFLTYADDRIRKYIREELRRMTWNSSFKELPDENGLTSDNDNEGMDDQSAHTSFTAPMAFSVYKTTPEDLVIRKKTVEKVRYHLDLLGKKAQEGRKPARYVECLTYRYGFKDRVFHTRKETAEYMNYKKVKTVKQVERKGLRALRDQYEMEAMLWRHNHLMLPIPSCERDEIKELLEAIINEYYSLLPDGKTDHNRRGDEKYAIGGGDEVYADGLAVLAR